MMWDILLILLSVVACLTYVVDTYLSTYKQSQDVLMIELVITQFFSVDFFLHWYIDGTLRYLISSMVLIDLVTILPVYITLAVTTSTRLGFLRFIRILRLIRVFRTFKVLRNLSGIKRQIISLVLTLLSMTFLAAGMVQLMENDISQYRYDCQYINSKTYWEPSCSPNAPADDSCDCESNNCEPYYQRGDSPGHPTAIKCVTLTYFEAFYFIVVTVSTVGYGDIAPTTTYSRAVIIVFIVASLIIIPMQVNKLQVLLSMRSVYRNPYHAHSSENHVILCGHVNDKSKLEKFFKEFFHPDRVFSSAPEFHAVVLCPLEPSEEVRTLMMSPMLDSRVTYVIGSALSVEDLKKVRADVASGMFFLCNTEIGSSAASLEDAATVMRALSVSNFNAELDCLVQVIRPEDRTILKDSDIDVILCLDEFKTALQARNSICPGFSTFIENIFHSFGAVSSVIESTLDPWYTEYLHGARMEMYFVPLDKEFLRIINYNYDKLCEAIYLEWQGIVVLGLCSQEKDEMTFNPTRKDLGEHVDFKSFFNVFNVALIMADDQMQAEQIARGLCDPYVVIEMLNKMEEEEEQYACLDQEMGSEDGPMPGRFGGGGGSSDRPSGSSEGSGLGLTRLVRGASFRNSYHPSKKKKIYNTKNLQLREFAQEPLSDSDDEDESYVGYVTVTADLNKGGVGAGGARQGGNGKHIDRKMSSDSGGGMVSKRQATPPLLGARKQLLHAPNVESEVAMRRTMRQSMIRKSNASSVKEEEEEEDEGEEGENDAEGRLSTVSVLSQVPTVSKLSDKDKLTIVSPSALAASPISANRPKMLPRGATESTGLGRPKEIRPTLKELSRGAAAGTGNGKASEGKESELELAHKSVPPPQPLTRVLSRGATEPLIKRIPTPTPDNFLKATSQTTAAAAASAASSSSESDSPLPSPDTNASAAKGRKHSDYKPSKLLAAPVDYDSHMDRFGVPSQVVEHVTVDNHIIVFGNDSNLTMFISELRRPSVKGSSYHPLVIVCPTLPSKWEAIRGRYNDIYVLLGAFTRSAVFNRANVEQAFAVILLATEDGITTVEEENIDSSTLFAYLKLEQYIPRDVFFSVELTCSSNMAVLNATIMKRARRNPSEYFRSSRASEIQLKKESNGNGNNSAGGLPGDRPVLQMQASLDPYTSPPPPTSSNRKDSGDDDDLKRLTKKDHQSGGLMKTEAGDHLGRFTSKRSTLRQTVTNPTLARLPTNIGRRASTIDIPTADMIPSLKDVVSVATGGGGGGGSPVAAGGGGGGGGGGSFQQQQQHQGNEESRFWDATDTHHMLPVFASARAYVPSSFESLLVQSFFGVLTPLICEKLVCGQAGQIVLQADVPAKLVGRKFIDLFRSMSKFHITCFGLYRAPSIPMKAILPYVYISPPPTAILAKFDKIFVYGKPSRLARALAFIDNHD